jgi:alcohol dehydrogenase YqhD (iron-dependent ADH family)
MKEGPKLMNKLDDVELRSSIMLDATLALNGITSYGKQSGDWGVHCIGHELSLLYDTPHGATLSIAYLGWLKLHASRCPERIIKLGKNIFGVETVDGTIERLTEFFKNIQSPVNLAEAKIGVDQRQIILKQMNENSVSGVFHKLSEKDHAELVDLMM